jgi:hypothetical protein
MRFLLSITLAVMLTIASAQIPRFTGGGNASNGNGTQDTNGTNGTSFYSLWSSTADGNIYPNGLNLPSGGWVATNNAIYPQ